MSAETAARTAAFNAPGVKFLMALQRVLPRVYEGTVPPAEVARRRAANRVARRSRRANR